MSTAMTMTMAAAGATSPMHMTSLATSLPSSPCCPKCGFDLAPTPSTTAADADDAESRALADAQRQIDDLQAQVRLLNEKAAAAVDRWADYEDELARLRAAVASPMPPSPGPSPPSKQATPSDQRPASPSSSSFLPAGAATRLAGLLSPRPARSTPNLKASAAARRAVGKSPSTPPPVPALPSAATSLGLARPGSSASTSSFNASSADAPPLPTTSTTAAATTSSTSELLEALSREQSLRKAAEGRLNATSREVEELSVSLFEQANEMVAAERRARARLEERVEVLERRDVEKRARLERLEGAMGRIERVRALLGPGQGLRPGSAG